VHDDLPALIDEGQGADAAVGGDACVLNFVETADGLPGVSKKWQFERARRIVRRARDVGSTALDALSGVVCYLGSIPEFLSLGGELRAHCIG